MKELLDKLKTSLVSLYENGELYEEFKPMRGCCQHTTMHKEGDVLTHTDLVIKECFKLEKNPHFAETWHYFNEEQWAILKLACLCHDIGKPLVTEFNEAKQQWTAYKHGKEGVEPTEKFLRRMNVDEKYVKIVSALVHRHMDPFSFIKQDTGEKGYKKLRLQLNEAGTDYPLLVALALCDHRGRIFDGPDTTEKDLKDFVRKISDVGVQKLTLKD